MNAEESNRLSDRLNSLYQSISQLEVTIERRDHRIKILEQENEDLKGQLRQWGIDAREAANTRLANGAKKGLFLK